MKKSLLFLFLISTLFIFKSEAQDASAERKARKILKEVTEKYDKLNTIEAHFSYNLTNPQDHISETQSGVLFVHPSDNKYHVTLNGTELISDGKLTYTYLKSQKEVQVNKIDTNSQAINPARIFSIYEKGFKYAYKEERTENKQKLDVIDLYPLNSKKISRAQVFIIKHLKQVYEIKLFDKNGNEYTYTVNQFIPNPDVDAGKFSFDKKDYPGVEVIDLR